MKNYISTTLQSVSLSMMSSFLSASSFNDEKRYSQPNSQISSVDNPSTDCMAQIRRCLRASECIGLANDLIKGRPLEKEIIKWQKSRFNYNESSPVLGRKW